MNVLRIVISILQVEKRRGFFYTKGFDCVMSSRLRSVMTFITQRKRSNQLSSCKIHKTLLDHTSWFRNMFCSPFSMNELISVLCAKHLLFTDAFRYQIISECVLLRVFIQIVRIVMKIGQGRFKTYLQICNFQIGKSKILSNMRKYGCSVGIFKDRKINVYNKLYLSITVTLRSRVYMVLDSLRFRTLLKAWIVSALLCCTVQ